MLRNAPFTFGNMLLCFIEPLGGSRELVFCFDQKPFS